jgi:hypothetical protein
MILAMTAGATLGLAIMIALIAVGAIIGAIWLFRQPPNTVLPEELGKSLTHWDLAVIGRRAWNRSRIAVILGAVLLLVASGILIGTASSIHVLAASLPAEIGFFANTGNEAIYIWWDGSYGEWEQASAIGDHFSQEAIGFSVRITYPEVVILRDDEHVVAGTLSNAGSTLTITNPPELANITLQQSDGSQYLAAVNAIRSEVPAPRPTSTPAPK